MKNIYKMTIAAVLAATMGSALAEATDITGVAEDTFQFNQIGSSLSPVNGSGVTAITNINAILDAVGGQGGSAIIKDSFWKSFISPARIEVFDYNSAAPMIAELVFTVTGEYHTGTEWKNTDDVSGGQYFKDAALLETSNIATGADADGKAIYGNTWVDGGLKESGEAAVALLSTVGFTVTEGTLGSIDPSVPAVNVDNFVDPTIANVSTLLATVLTSSTFSTEAGDATVDAIAFTRANTLIAQIADQLKNGYVLDVAAATAAVDRVIDHHNGYLSASIVAQAEDLKVVIKTIGLQVAAAGVGKGTADVCVSGTSTVSKAPACVAIGQKFTDITSDILGLSLSATAVSDYNTAVSNIVTFAGNLTAFNNSSVAAFTATDSTAAKDAADAIDSQFGTIMVKEGTDAYNHLEANSNSNLFGVSDWTSAGNSDVALDSGVVLFDTDFDISITSEDGSETASSNASL